MKFLQYLYAKIKTKLVKGLIMSLVDTKNKTIITFKNGSVIECSNIENKNKVTRGHRSKYIYPFSDYEFDKEQFNEVIKEYFKTS